MPKNTDASRGDVCKKKKEKSRLSVYGTKPSHTFISILKMCVSTWHIR